METTTTSITSQLLSMGLPGIVIIGLAFVIYTLYKQNIADKKAHAEEQKLLAKDQRELHVKTIEVVERNTAALDKHTEIVAKVVETNRRRRGDPQ